MSKYYVRTFQFFFIFVLSNILEFKNNLRKTRNLELTNKIEVLMSALNVRFCFCLLILSRNIFTCEFGLLIFIFPRILNEIGKYDHETLRLL